MLQGADLEHLAQEPLLGRHGMLTLSDDPAALHIGVMIALAEQRGRIVFDVNNAAAGKAGLVISSRLLRLARSVR